MTHTLPCSQSLTLAPTPPNSILAPSRQVSKSRGAPNLHRTHFTTITKSRGASSTRSAHAAATVKSRAFNLGQTLRAIEQYVELATTDPTVFPEITPIAIVLPTPPILDLEIPGLSSLPRLVIAPRPNLGLRPIQRIRSKSRKFILDSTSSCL